MKKLFEQSLPERSYCCDDFGCGLRILPRPAAIRRRHIQPQPPWEHRWLLFDVDREGAWNAAEEAGLPPPTFISINRSNGHAHLGYGLKAPVLMGGKNRRKPILYLKDIERAMTAALKADVMYRGFICKNPLHDHWETVWSEHLFDLKELQGWLGDLTEYQLPKRTIGVGRNVETFDAVRKWAYAGGGGNVLRHKAAGGSLDEWRSECIGAARRFTDAHHVPTLYDSECRWIGRSVAKWTWGEFTMVQFAAIQKKRAMASVAKRREVMRERDWQVAKLARIGMKQEAIAAELNCSQSTVSRALRRYMHEPYQDVCDLPRRPLPAHEAVVAL